MISLRIPAFVLALLVTLTLSATAAAEADSEIDDHLDDARSLYEAGHWQAASEAFEQAWEDAEDGTRLKAASALEYGTMLWEQGRYEEAEQLVGQSLDLARELDLDEATGELLSTLGHIETSRGKLSEAENTLDACIQMTRQLGDDVHEALCRLNRRTVRELQGQDPGPEQQFRADVQTLEDAESALSTGVSLTKTAQLYRDNDNFDRAGRLLVRADEIYEAVGNVPGQLRNRLRRAQLEHHRGNFEEGRQLVDGLLDKFREMEMKPMVVHTLALHAEDAIQQGDIATGVSHYRQGLSVAQSISNPQLAGRTHLALCEINFADSPEHCEKATELFESTGMETLEIRARSAWGRALQTRGEYEEARSLYRTAIEDLEDRLEAPEGPAARSLTFQQTNLCQVNAELGTTGGYGSCTDALELFDEVEDVQRDRPDLYAAAVHGTARTALDADRNAEALERFEEAAQLYLELDEPAHQLLAADILLRLGGLQKRIDEKREKAPKTFRRGLELTESDEIDLQETDAANTRISLKTQLAQYHLNRNGWSEAIDALEPLVDFAEDTGDAETAAWAYSGLANAYLQTDRRDDALEALETGHPLAKQAEDEDLVETFEENLEEMKD